MTDDETKTMRDALIFGTGFMQDGRHVPMEAVMADDLDDLVKRLRIGIHTSADEQALRDEAADRIEALEAALRIAAGYISTKEGHTDQHPQDVYDWIARAALGEKKDG